MEIKVGTGIKNIFFGMTQSEVKAILAEPDKIIKDEDLDWITYAYNEEMLQFVFAKEEKWNIITIEVHNQDIELFNENIFNKSKDEVKKVLIDHGYNGIEYEDNGYFDSLFCGKIHSSFIFEFDKLQHIKISPIFDTDDKVIWPRMIKSIP